MLGAGEGRLKQHYYYYYLSTPGSGFSETSKDQVTNRASREQPEMENDDVVQRHENTERIFFSKPLLPTLYPRTMTLIDTEKFSPETWLHPNIPDNLVQLEEFQPVFREIVVRVNMRRCLE